MTQVFTPNNGAGYCTKCQRGYAIGPHACPDPIANQLDMMPGALVDGAVLERIAEQLPKAREVTSRLPLDGVLDRADVGHELVLPERAREDHR
ncbi:MAG TPA: hypothetical protein VGD45_20465 [Steroidobacter sp.]|uniref:hypothetical protein n=1 Tax=Steroidobacter sp. TaxID=1978227 RepID=UPI002EDA9085